MNTALHRLSITALVVIMSCNPRTSSPTSFVEAPVSADASPPVAVAMPLERRIPNVCSVFGRPHCQPCEGSGCPLGDSGFLCCDADHCVEAGPTDCNINKIFWCENYSTSPDPATGLSVATCHDSAD